MDLPEKAHYEFGSFQFDPNHRSLLCDGQPITLTPKNLETLQVLLEQRGRVLEKDELLELLWPDSVVEENNLTQNISALRKALGDKPGEQRFIKTIPGRGYRFVADVREIAPATLIVQESKLRVVIEEEMEGGSDGEKEGQSDRAIACPLLRLSVSPSLRLSVSLSLYTNRALGINSVPQWNKTS